MTSFNKSNAWRRVNSCTKKLAHYEPNLKQSNSLLPSSNKVLNTFHPTEKQKHGNFISMKNLNSQPSHFTHVINNPIKRETTYQKTVQENINPLVQDQNNKTVKKRKRNIIKFESKLNEMQPQLKHIWKRAHEERHEMFIDKSSQKNVNKNVKEKQQKQRYDERCNSKKIISLKSIKSIENILSPQSSNALESHSDSKQEESFQEKLKKLRNQLNLKHKILVNAKTNQQIDNHNTSIVTQNILHKLDPTVSKEQIKEENHQESRYSSSLALKSSQKFASHQKLPPLSHLPPLPPISSHIETLLLPSQQLIKPSLASIPSIREWEQSNLDVFQSKLQTLMLKAKRNSKSRINLIKMINYPITKTQNDVGSEINF